MKWKRLDNYSAQSGNWRISRAWVNGWVYTFWEQVNGEWLNRGRPKNTEEAEKIWK